MLQGLLSGTISTIVVTLGAPRIGRDRASDWMEIGTVLLGADSVEIEPRWWHIAAGAGLFVLLGLEVLARADREPSWPLKSAHERATDTQFLRHMEAHHAVGVELATLAASNAGDPKLRRLGRLMAANQGGEIRIITRWWRSWRDGPLPPMSAEERAGIPGMPQPHVIAQISAERGDRFDTAFVPVMIDHHRGAIHMADEAWRMGGDPRGRLLADSIRHAQRRQKSAMAAIRSIK